LNILQENLEVVCHCIEYIACFAILFTMHVQSDILTYLNQFKITRNSRDL